MARMERHETLGAYCDRPGCDELLRFSEALQGYGGDQFLRLLDEAGWSVWVGRSQRHYCPAHGPSKRSITPDRRGEAPMRRLAPRGR